jgi:pyruvate-ferredoxin/flavodoxin oxidoreductase
VVARRFLNKKHRAYIPDWGVYITVMNDDKSLSQYSVSRQMVLFCVERRKAWRMLQSKARIQNLDYQAQRAVLKAVDAGEIAVADLHEKGRELVLEKREEIRTAAK